MLAARSLFRVEILVLLFHGPVSHWAMPADIGDRGDQADLIKYIGSSAMGQGDLLARTEAEREIWRKLMAPLWEQEAPAMHGRGVIIVGGRNSDGSPRPYYTLDGLLTIAALRWSGCSLPVELWHDHDPALRRLTVADALWDSNVTLRDFWDLPGGEDLGGWQLPSMALLYSEFAEALYIDADNVPLMDPTLLFEGTAFRRAGAVFWPDLDLWYYQNPMWSVASRNFIESPGTESGQILVNRSKRGVMVALALGHHFNCRGPEFYYGMFYGNKELWRFAWLALRQPHVLVPRLPDVVGFLADGGQAFCGHTLLQREPSAQRPAFAHRVMHKLSMALEKDGPSWTAIKVWTERSSRAHASKKCRLHERVIGFDIDEDLKSSPEDERLLWHLLAMERDLLLLRSLIANNNSELRRRWWITWANSTRRLSPLGRLSREEVEATH